jgi:peptide/nickel transport system permease protein
MRYLTRRILHIGFLLLGVSLLSFLLTQLAPGSFVDDMTLNPQIAPGTLDALRSRYGLDQPWTLRYLSWLKGAMTGDLGFSFAYNSSVAALLGQRMFNTLLLTITATSLAWAIALPLGIRIASWRGGLLDRICSSGTSALLAIPDVALALAMLLLAVRSGLFPAGGMFSAGSADLPFWGKARDLAAHLFLPTLALVLGALPMLVRHVRASVVDLLDAPFVRTGLAHGIPRRRLLWRHVLPAAANPLISLLGFSVGTLLSASLLVEVIMGWPGLGPLVLEAILARDVYLVIGAVMVSTVFLAAGNLISDLLLYAADPRIRRE